jgi:hypothetical protein
MTTPRSVAAPSPRPTFAPAPTALAAAALLAAALGCGTLLPSAHAQQMLHFTYLWHMEQPIYWPDGPGAAPLRYERAWETIQALDAGRARPLDNLRAIFGLDDRVAGYQYRVRDSVNDIRWHPEAGAQVSYSGGLIENITSLGNANQLGYSPNWFGGYREARTWTTFSGPAHPRLDIVQFSFHHALLPLLDDAVIRKELALYRRIYADAWGANPGPSRGFFPSEMAFSTRLIPLLRESGIDWTVVSAEKISRACPDFPVVFGSGGINCDAPNKADQLNPAGNQWYRQSISRGCSPVEAVPLALTPQRARYIDPITGAASSIILIPASQGLSWRDGYAPLGTTDFNNLDAISRAQRPMLITLAHDGDNAWGGGFSYYREAVPNLVGAASAQGFGPTTIERYLADHPVPTTGFVHVEQGAWVNADGCFGSPQFLNWNWPPVNAQGQVDIANGWAEDIRNWSVITAATNRLITAEQIWLDTPGNQVDVARILYPTTAGTNPVERAWHFFLGGLNSGFMYYGTALDMENKPAVAANRAAQYADPVIAGAPATSDRTAPTIWQPQRHPWNPGSTNFGPQTGYRQVQSSGDFWVWTFAYDTSGIASATLKYRIDADGVRSLASTENETYAGGPGVGAWVSVPMTARPFPMNNVFNDPGISYYATPNHAAAQYHAQITGLRSKLVDYYIESVDTRGNIARSPISSVWIGDGQGAGPGPAGPRVALAPAAPVAGQPLTVTYNPFGGPLSEMSGVTMYWGINDWTNITPDTRLTQISGGPDAGKWTTTITVPPSATSIQMVFNNSVPGFAPTVWDNNSGADYRFTVTGGAPVPTWTIDGTLDTDATLTGTAGNATLWAGLKGDVLYLATQAPTDNRDRFLLVAANPGAPRAAMWAKAGLVASWDAFIGAEVSNAFAGWFDAGAGVATQVARASHVEGTINLRQELGLAPGAPLPASVRVALGVYASPDAGALVTAQQPTPPGAGNADQTIDASEYFTLSLRTSCGFGDIAGPGPSVGFDGELTADDVIQFIAWFTAADDRADIASPGPSVGPDAEFTADDVILFISRFTAGC